MIELNKWAQFYPMLHMVTICSKSAANFESKSSQNLFGPLFSPFKKVDLFTRFSPKVFRPLVYKFMPVSVYARFLWNFPNVGPLEQNHLGPTCWIYHIFLCFWSPKNWMFPSFWVPNIGHSRLFGFQIPSWA